MKLIGVDVGGTFTDVMYGDTESQAVAIHKVPTTPDDPSRGAIQGMVEICERFDEDRSAVDHVLHGTTIAINAVLEYKGATTGMVTTEGYRDILHIGRHQRPQHYSIMQDIPGPTAPPQGGGRTPDAPRRRRPDAPGRGCGAPGGAGAEGGRRRGHCRLFFILLYQFGP